MLCRQRSTVQLHSLGCYQHSHVLLHNALQTITLGGGGGSGAKTATTAGISDVWYDIAGWGLLVAIGFGIVALSKNAPQPGGAPAIK